MLMNLVDLYKVHVYESVQIYLKMEFFYNSALW